MTLALVVFYFSATFLPGPLLRPLEDRYPVPLPEEIEKAQAIVLLPAYISPKPKASVLDHFGGETAKRLLAALMLKKRLPERPLIIVGTGASFLAEVARGLGYERVLAHDEAPDTVSSARILKEKLSGRPFLLVTAAYHLPRAVYLFEREGLEPIPYPAYRIGRREHGITFRDFWPDPVNLFYADVAVHEYLGLAFYHVLEHIPFHKNSKE